MVLAGILAVLTLTHRVQVWHVFLLAALMGVVNAFDIPARQAFLSDMVGRENMMNAIALNSSMFNGARIVGPAVAGLLVASIGEGWCFAANSLSYIAVIAGLLMMRMAYTPRAGARDKSPLAGHHGRFPVRERCQANPHTLTLARTGEPGGNALLRADADLCRSHPARRSAGPGHPDGRNRCGRTERGIDPRAEESR